MACLNASGSRTDAFEQVAELHQTCDLIDEPWVDLAPVRNRSHVETSPQSLGHLEDPMRSRNGELVEHLLIVEATHDSFGGIGIQTKTTVFQAAQGLLQSFGKGAADGHCFSHASHRCAQSQRSLGKLRKVEARNLDHDVVERRLE